MPDPGNPLAWDRYSYVYNNPIKYVDGSGNIPSVPATLIRGASGSPIEGVNPILMEFDPFMGAYIDLYFDGELDEETRQRLEEVWYGARDAYVAYGIDLEEIAENPDENPLPSSAIDNFIIDSDIRIAQSLLNNYGHTPFQIFMLAIAGYYDNDLDILRGENELMQYESYYLSALMEAHPDLVTGAFIYYQENKDLYDKQDVDELPEKIIDNIIMYGVE